MAKENSNKVKLLKLIELLRQESDEQHPMRGSIVCQRLSEMNITYSVLTFIVLNYNDIISVEVQEK